jgi:hypothetical protein
MLKTRKSFFIATLFAVAVCGAQSVFPFQDGGRTFDEFLGMVPTVRFPSASPLPKSVAQHIKPEQKAVVPEQVVAIPQNNSTPVQHAIASKNTQTLLVAIGALALLAAMNAVINAYVPKNK